MAEGAGRALNTTKETIRVWLKQAKKLKATHLLVVCDQFELEDYPVFIVEVPYSEQVTTEQEYAIIRRVHSVRHFVEKYYRGHGTMQQAMAVYLVSADPEEQLEASSNWRYE